MFVHRRCVALPAVGLLAAAALAGCGSGSGQSAGPSPSTSVSATFNAADVAFVRGVAPLEDEATAMAGLAADHSSQSQMQRLAAQMHARSGVAGEMRGWMNAWHQAAPPTYSPGGSPAAGMGSAMGSGMASGMMDSQHWAQMSSEHGQTFDRDWVDSMIQHHTAEIALCQAELGSGANPQARSLAQGMMSERSSELNELQSWHDSWAA